jgi:hypothetical protein
VLPPPNPDSYAGQDGDFGTERPGRDLDPLAEPAQGPARLVAFGQPVETVLSVSCVRMDNREKTASRAGSRSPSAA